MTDVKKTWANVAKQLPAVLKIEKDSEKSKKETSSYKSNVGWPKCRYCNNLMVGTHSGMCHTCEDEINIDCDQEFD